MDHNACSCKGMHRKLYRASGCGDANLLDEVLEEGTVNILQEATPAGDTALHRAAFHGHAELARKLIQLASQNVEAGMQFLTAQNTDGNTALHAAAEGGCEEIVKELVKKDGGVACVKNKAGETALFKACENGHLGIVECLLKCTPESEEVDRRADGQTPLHVAVSHLRTGVTRKLLDERPSLVGKADDFQRTALHILALVPLINPNPFPLNPLGVWYSRAIIKKIGKLLLSKEFSLIYRVDADGQSALHVGAKVGNANLVKVILSHGNDCIEIRDKDDRTALHMAVENASQVYKRVGQYALRCIISSLAQRRVINCSNNNGQTALDVGIKKTKEDKQLFLAITNYLRRHSARQNMFETETGTEADFTSSKSIMEIISVNAVLIATVAFAAAFTLPGNINSNANPPVPFLLNVSLFKLFILFDTFAFCNAVGSAFLLIFALFGNQREDPFIVDLSYVALCIAMTSIALAFGAAIHLVVAPKCMWLAVLVWIMVCFMPIGVRFKSLHGKLHMFMESKWKPLQLFIDAISLMIQILLIACMPLSLLIMSATWIWDCLIKAGKMLVGMLSRTRKKRTVLSR